MNLLDKRVVNVAVATQKKLQIDEGLAIAKKVDAVRETLGTEEQRLREFRTQTTAQVQKDIDDLVLVKDRLLKDIKDATEDKRLAQIPLDAEWATVEQEKTALEALKQGLFEREGALDERTLQVEKREKESMEETDRIDGLKRQAVEALTTANTTLERAKEYSAQIRNDAQAVLTAAEVKEAEVNAREEKVAIREKKATKEREEIIKNYDDLAHKAVLIQDREDTVARDVQRLQEQEQALAARESVVTEREAGSDAYVTGRTKEAETIEGEIGTLLIRQTHLTEAVTQKEGELATMRKEEEAAAKRIRAGNAAFAEQEKDMTARLEALEQKEVLTSEKEKELDVRERRLIDQYASLAKATEQVNKRYG